MKMLKGFLKTLIIMIFIGCIAAGVYVFLVIQKAEPIDPSNIYENIGKDSYIYDKDGELIQTLNYGEDRELITMDEVPPNLKNAFVAIEDRTFYNHSGFNFKRMIGAIWESIIGKDRISGTSTITQQLARNIYLADIKSQRTLQRKITEMYYAWRIETTLSKQEIMEAYLNVIYLGYGSYGVKAAAKTYFSKDVSDLTLEECAALAALPQAPDTYALLKDEDGETHINDESKERRFLVLDLMVEQHYISKEEAEAAKTDLKDFINPSVSEKDSVNTYFCDYVISQVITDLSKEMTEEEAERCVYAGGLHIYTTLNSDMQNIIYEEFLNDYNFPWAEEKPQAAMVIVDMSGRVLAMMGGRNAEGEHLFNRAVNPRQPGSSIKPLSVYSAALQKSLECEASGQKYPFENLGHDKQGISGWGDYITAGSTVKDEKMYFNGEIWPYNASKIFSGNQTFRTALQQSINTCAVKIQLQVGAKYSINMLKDFGISTVVEEGEYNDENPAALALGAMTNGVTPLEMALAYATFPNGGVRNSAVCYTEIKDSNGEVVLKGESEETRVLDEGVAWIMTDCLKSVVSNGIGRNAAIRGVAVGGKTGTTNDQYDIWFDGFTPSYAAALWIGTDNNVRMSSMSGVAASLWGRIMSQIPDDGEYRSMPSNVIRYRGEYYTEGTQSYVKKEKDDDEIEGGGTFVQVE